MYECVREVFDVLRESECEECLDRKCFSDLRCAHTPHLSEMKSVQAAWSKKLVTRNGLSPLHYHLNQKCLEVATKKSILISFVLYLRVHADVSRKEMIIFTCKNSCSWYYHSPFFLLCLTFSHTRCGFLPGLWSSHSLFTVIGERRAAAIFS